MTTLTRVVIADHRPGVRTDIASLIAREEQGHSALHTSRAGLFAVEVKRDVPSLGQASTVVSELHAHLMRADGYGFCPRDGEALQPHEVVAIRRLAVFDVEGPARERAALCDDHPFDAAFG